MPFAPCRKIFHLMKNFHYPWFFAGGWAIDLHIGKVSRNHSDIEIAIFRKNQLHLKDYLKDYGFLKVINGEFLPWTNEYLELPIHEIHGINKQNGEKLEIMLNETEDEKWKFRRDMRVSYPINKVYSHTKEGIPYLNPEIVLLYKVKNTRKKDHQDFITVKDYLSNQQKKWLRDVIMIHEPNHEWLKHFT